MGSCGRRVPRSEQQSLIPAAFHNAVVFSFLQFSVSFLIEDGKRKSIKTLALCYLTVVSRKAPDSRFSA